MSQPQHKQVMVAVDSVKPHPRNYRKHPEYQLEHLKRSITEHGLYRNVVLADDLTILAGHGVVLAAKELGISKVPAIKLDVAADSVEAMKLIAGDNEIAGLGDVDERALAELLNEVLQLDPEGLMGTGITEAQFAALDASLGDGSGFAEADAQSEWQGMPAWEQDDQRGVQRIIVHFKTREDVAEFGRLVNQNITDKTLTIWFPEAERGSTTDTYWDDAAAS